MKKQITIRLNWEEVREAAVKAVVRELYSNGVRELEKRILLGEKIVPFDINNREQVGEYYRDAGIGADIAREEKCDLIAVYWQTSDNHGEVVENMFTLWDIYDEPITERHEFQRYVVGDPISKS